MNERRQLPRENVSYRVQYCRVDHDDIAHDERESVTVNASDAGLALISTEAFDLKETVALRIHAGVKKPPIQAVGQVIWCRTDGDSAAKFVIGLKFVWVGSPLGLNPFLASGWPLL